MSATRSSESRMASRLLAAILLCNAITGTIANPSSTHGVLARNFNPNRAAHWGPPTKRDGSIPLIIGNQCGENIWPGIGTQAGTGPGDGGFLLEPGETKSLTVSSDWQGRVWGRTNCSFNVGGSGASNLNGNNGAGAACDTGDCNGVLSCVVTGNTPVTLFEIDLAGGTGNKQSFYDISLVDGYNLPMGIEYLPGDDSTLKDIPPNLTNVACIATANLLAEPSAMGDSGNSTDSSYPIPYESSQTSSDVAGWCPWPLQQTQPKKPGDGVYPYPDDDIQRPIFDPCLSACAKSNSPEDCCTGSYDSPSNCKPTLYARNAKTVCPDAYSYAFDDQTSTFIVPSGGGWQVNFCPSGRSTNILKTFQSQLQALAQGGTATKAILDAAGNVTIILEAGKSNAAAEGETNRAKSAASWGALVVVLAWALLWS